MSRLCFSSLDAGFLRIEELHHPICSSLRPPAFGRGVSCLSAVESNPNWCRQYIHRVEWCAEIEVTNSISSALVVHFRGRPSWCKSFRRSWSWCVSDRHYALASFLSQINDTRDSFFHIVLSRWGGGLRVEQSTCSTGTYTSFEITNKLHRMGLSAAPFRCYMYI